MEANIKLVSYTDEKEILRELIKKFWLAHNDYVQSDEEAMEDLCAWTSAQNRIYLIEKDESFIGFIHLGSRGAEIDWVEDLFILPEYQGNGYGSMALNLVEQIVKEYSESIYLEVAARNMDALRLYRRNGYDCLNTITIRKDFEPENFDVLRTENLLGHEFEVKKYKG